MNVRSDSLPSELSLRDLYDIVKRWRMLILGLPVLVAALTLVGSFLLPRIYTSRAVVSLTLANQQNQQGLLNNLPSLTGLAQGFVDLQATTLLAQELGVTDPTQFYEARFDDKRNLLNLSAQGGSPKEAFDRATRILNVARNYLRERMAEGAQANIRAALTQTQLDLQVAQDGLRRIQAQLQSTTGRNTSNGTVAAGLEARGNDPQAARAVNPGLTSLSLDESRLRSEIAKSEARIDTLTKFLNQPEQINQLVGQALLVQVLVPPAEPLRATFPRPVLFTAVAAVLGLLIGLLWAFVAEAVRPRP
ncbi:MAG: Wzz/FepE/Etk N-terminal domain-containing protein [Meiothermus sp.]|nr:Wzz/FepE/Etk N-terminal domain-containing protein [Meiothermus sp.]